MIELVPVKPGSVMFERMKVEYNFDAVLRTAVEECGIDSESEAAYLLDAFLQWFSVIPARGKDAVYVMLKSDVDRIFHAFVLNTKSYREFCESYLGHFLDHTPVEGDVAGNWVTYTVDLLKRHYGDELHPALQGWEDMVEAGSWRVSCKW